MSLQTLNKDQLIRMVLNAQDELQNMKLRYQKLEALVNGADMYSSYREAMDKIEIIEKNYIDVCKQYTTIRDAYDMQCTIISTIHQEKPNSVKGNINQAIGGVHDGQSQRREKKNKIPKEQKGTRTAGTSEPQEKQNNKKQNWQPQPPQGPWLQQQQVESVQQNRQPRPQMLPWMQQEQEQPQQNNKHKNKHNKQHNNVNNVNNVNNNNFKN